MSNPSVSDFKPIDQTTINQTLAEKDIKVGFENNKGVIQANGRTFHVNIIDASKKHFSLNDSAMTQVACRVAYMLFTSGAFDKNFKEAQIDASKIKLKNPNTKLEHEETRKAVYKDIQNIIQSTIQTKPKNVEEKTDDKQIDDKQILVEEQSPSFSVSIKKHEPKLEENKTDEAKPTKTKTIKSRLEDMLTSARNLIKHTKQLSKEIDKLEEKKKLSPNESLKAKLDEKIKGLKEKFNAKMQELKEMVKGLNQNKDDPTVKEKPKLKEKFLSVLNKGKALIFKDQLANAGPKLGEVKEGLQPQGIINRIKEKLSSKAEVKEQLGDIELRNSVNDEKS